MERALIPRTADGLIEPMIFLNEPPKEKLYPHIGGERCDCPHGLCERL